MKRDTKSKQNLEIVQPKKDKASVDAPAVKTIEPAKLKSARAVRVSAPLEKPAKKSPSQKKPATAKTTAATKAATAAKASVKKTKAPAAVVATNEKKSPKTLPAEKKNTVPLSPAKASKMKKAAAVASPPAKMMISTQAAAKSAAPKKEKTPVNAASVKSIAAVEKPTAKKMSRALKMQPADASKTTRKPVTVKTAPQPDRAVIPTPAAPAVQKKLRANKTAESPAPAPKTLKKTAAKPVATVETSPMPVAVAPPAKPVKKKIKPIGSAVLRGKSGRYDFEIFPLDAEFDRVPAIYVISKRVTDKQKRGHHRLICIGETASIFDDIKKHKKNKCIKANQANVVCLLKEQDENSRLRIANDLREAHAIVCDHK